MTTKTLFFIAGTFITGMVLVIAREPITAGIEAATGPALALAAIAGAIAVAVVAWLGYEYAMSRRARRRLAEAEADKAAAEARKARRESDIYTVTHRADEVLHVYDDRKGYWRNAALDPRLYANGPESAPPTGGELATWAAWQQLHATAKKPQITAPAEDHPVIEQPLPPLLDVLYNAPRIALGGSSGAGKTTVAKMLMAEDMHRGKKVMFVSPHEQGTIGGVPVVGCGRNYADIALVLEALVLLMTKRYRDVATGEYAHFSHHPISVYVDEWTSIKNEVEDAGAMLGTLITEARKVSMGFTVLTHSLQVNTLGINTDLRQSLTLAWLDGGEGQPFEAAIHKYGPTGKLEVLPHRHPGYYDVTLPDNFVVDIPSPQVIKAQTMKAGGASDTAVAKEIFGVKKPSRDHISKARLLIAGGTLEARQ